MAYTKKHEKMQPENLKKYSFKMSFRHKTVLKIVSMVVHRKDTAKRKFEVKKIRILRKTDHKKNPEDRTSRPIQKDMTKDEK